MTSSEFSYIFENPIKSADSAYTVLARVNSTGNSRLGVIVSKKNISSAVKRNRMKRIVRESFRLHKTNINSLDVVVICKKNSERIVNKKLFKQLDKHWKLINEQGQ
ncbi:MAG: ribonuclease P protein component [Pseudomonadota bacterium]